MQTIDPEEIARFSRIADEWWDEEGKFKPLHHMNPLRISYIRDEVAKWRGGEVASDNATPLQGLKLLDIGCGGGLMAEPFCRLGAEVTAIDASEKNIKVASLHATQGGLSIDYRCAAVEDLPDNVQYDVVLALEIVEHVANPADFVALCLKRVKPGGLVFFSTLNRTMKSFAFAIVGAEYVLQWLPKGTHEWKKFLRPSELVSMIEQGGGAVREMTGMVMHPLTQEWKLNCHDLSVNYMVVANFGYKSD